MASDEHNPTVDLRDLVGTRVLDGVSRTVEPHVGDSDTKTVARLRLNGVVYRFEEDPEDGYRSCLRGIVVCQDPVVTFEPVIVTIEVDPEHEHVLVVRESMRARRVLCRVGTNQSSDYYPYYVFEWTPVDATVELPS